MVSDPLSGQQHARLQVLAEKSKSKSSEGGSKGAKGQSDDSASDDDLIDSAEVRCVSVILVPVG